METTAACTYSEIMSTWRHWLTINNCKQYNDNLSFISYKCAVQEDSSSEINFVDIPSPSFLKETFVTFDISSGVNIRFVRRVHWVRRAFQIPMHFMDPQSEHQVLLNYCALLSSFTPTTQFNKHGLTSIMEWLSNRTTIKFWGKIFIHTHTSTVAP